MSEDFPTFNDVIDYKRRRLLTALSRLGPGGTEEARAEATGLLLDYVGDEEIRAAFERAVGTADT